MLSEFLTIDHIFNISTAVCERSGGGVVVVGAKKVSKQRRRDSGSQAMFPWWAVR
jgi:hypothetical protein